MISKHKNYLIVLLIFIGLFPALGSYAAYKVEVALPGLPPAVSDPGEYVRYLFIFGLSLAGFLAVGAVAVGGIQHMLSSSVGSTQKSKDMIVGALMGVGLLLGSYLLLTTIDPTLTNLSPKIAPLGNIAAPPVPAPGAGTCTPACTTGFRCDGTTYKCVKIEVTAPEMVKNQTPKQCDEFEKLGNGGCAQGHKVWNPNTCDCDVCSGIYKWDTKINKCILK